MHTSPNFHSRVDRISVCFLLLCLFAGNQQDDGHLAGIGADSLLVAGAEGVLADGILHLWLIFSRTEAKVFFQRQVSLDLLTTEESYSFPATELLALGSRIRQEMQEGENRTQHSPASRTLVHFQKCSGNIFVSLKTKVII